MTNERIKAWITKYALTGGIQLVDAEVCSDVNDNMISYGGGGFSSAYAHGKEWHRTPAAALARAEEMRKAKVESMEKSIERMKALKFVVPEV